jgi:trans-2,3-dihydro-3-hydroxyanthranilate isomerase
MKKIIEIFQIDAFTNSPLKGNSAAVTFGDHLSTKKKQSIAREMNLSETAFISKSKIADYKLQWFTPVTQVNICGHATIASLHYLREKKLLKEKVLIKVETRSGVLKCYRDKNQYYMQLPIPKLSIYKKSKVELLKILGLKTYQQRKDLHFVIVNNETCYVYVKSLNDLKNIKPDYNALINLGMSKKEFRIIVVYSLETFEKNNSAHSRCFAPFLGINEDPVTGSTNGPLFLVLKKLELINQQKYFMKVTFEQGDFIGRKGLVKVMFNADKNELFISGKAVTILKGNLAI